MTNTETPAEKGAVDPKADEAIKPFLQACMKLLCNQKAVENIQALIDNYVEIIAPKIKVKTLNKIYKKGGRNEKCV